jgi:hypothetical protein
LEQAVDKFRKYLKKVEANRSDWIEQLLYILMKNASHYSEPMEIKN